jgi:DNA-binding protein HU-beta
MNKSELVEAVAGKIDMSKTQTQGVIEALIEVVTKALKKGDEVRLVGFGTWTVAKRAATTGRNPRTGEPIKIPASKQPKFKAGKELERHC